MTAAELRLFPEPENGGDGGAGELHAQDYISCASGAAESPAQNPPELQVHQPATRDQIARQALEQLAAPEPDAFPRLGEAQQQAARSLSLCTYYDSFLANWREAQLASKAIKPNTLRDEKNHVRAFGTWDISHPPAGWPSEVPWSGCPLSHLTGARLWEFFSSKVAAGEWKATTAKSRWNHIRVVLNFAQRQSVIERVPTLTKFKQRLEELRDRDDDENVVPYSDGELGRLYAVLPDVVQHSDEVKSRSAKKLQTLRDSVVSEMRAAIVLVANCGARPCDWTQFEFGRQIKLAGGDVPSLASFKAEKTGKKHEVPLARVTTEHLDRLRRSHGVLPGIVTPLFPHLANIEAKKPMQSAAYRRSVKLLKEAIVRIGLEPAQFTWPWHAVRRSCNTRFNTHGQALNMGQIGHLITHGPDADVASQSYDNRLPSIAKAVETISWPQEFLG